MARRTLDDVFDYFVPPEEQRAARERTLPGAAETAASAPARWLLVVDPARLLHCALAADLAAGLARDGREALVVASFERPRLAPRADWHVAPPDAMRALLEAHPRAHAIVAVRPDEVGAAAGALGPAQLGGVILVVHPGAGGLRDALGLLRRMPALRGLRVAALLLGADRRDADAALRRLDGAARRQLGRGLDPLGSLPRDAATPRALLLGRPTLDVDPDADSARQILALCARLRGAPCEAA